MEGKEPRTKLVCNLGMADFFLIPGQEGTWRRTPQTQQADGKKMYVCKMLEDNSKEFQLPANDRVELIDEEA